MGELLIEYMWTDSTGKLRSNPTPAGVVDVFRTVMSVPQAGGKKIINLWVNAAGKLVVEYEE